MLKVKPNLERIYIDRPDFYGKPMIERHLKRYKWVLDKLKPTDVVLDACCGSGYGSHMIAQKCRYVLGLEVNKAAVSYAKEKYKLKNLVYDRQDLTDPCSIPYKSKFDVVVWIEAIEHFKEDQAAKILQRFQDHLIPGGKLLISTPDKEQSNGKNKYHVREYTMEDLRSLVSCFFKVKKWDVENKFIYMVAEQNGKYYTDR